jgi:hypothetical protein
MNFALFILQLVVGGFVARALFGLAIGLGWLLIKHFINDQITKGSREELIDKSFANQFILPETSPKILTASLGIAIPLYIWGLYAAFCVAVTLSLTTKPEVTWNWIYWISAFLLCTSLISQINPKTLKPFLPIHHYHTKGVFVGIATEASLLPAVAGFLIFAFFPSFALWPYGWILNMLNLSQYMRG